MRRLVLRAMLAAAPVAAQAADQLAVSVVAAENFYGSVAEQIAGPGATVASILSNPDQDPHLFETSPSVARRLAAARIVIVSGADYDPWMDTLLAAHAAPDRIVIRVAELVGRKSGDNPHLWYDPATMPTFARAFTAALDRAAPGHAAEHAKRLATFLDGLAPMRTRIEAIKAAHFGEAVTATEPVFGDMAAALGLVMRNERLQLAVMNGAEPVASDVAGFEQDLRRHSVRVLLYNAQASAPAAQRLLGIARESGVPVVGVSETEPVGLNYAAWMDQQLDALAQALDGRPIPSQ